MDREQLIRAAAALAPLGFLVGDWEGSGATDGAPTRGLVRARRVLAGTWLESIERLVDERGATIHEDRALYGYDPTSGLVVHYFTAPGHYERYAVLPLEGRAGVHWVPRDLGARVSLWPDGAGWRSGVWGPGGERMGEMVYRRAERDG